MRTEIAVIVGILGAAVLGVIGRQVGRHREMLIYGVGLGFTAVAYVLFGLQHGAPSAYFGREVIGAALYLLLAVLGTLRWPALLALGWIGHTAWDLFFHYANGPALAPEWYAFFCVGFDLVVGGYIAGVVVARSSRSRTAST